MPNYKLYIVSAEGRICPIGVWGELWIGGLSAEGMSIKSLADALVVEPLKPISAFDDLFKQEFNSFQRDRLPPLLPLRGIMSCLFLLLKKVFGFYLTLKRCVQATNWLRTLNDLKPLLQLPTDYPRPQEQTYDCDIVEYSFDNDILASLKNLAKENGVTLFMTLPANSGFCFQNIPEPRISR
jgi:hypothetical protein